MQIYKDGTKAYVDIGTNRVWIDEDKILFNDLSNNQVQVCVNGFGNSFKSIVDASEIVDENNQPYGSTLADVIAGLDIPVEIGETNSPGLDAFGRKRVSAPGNRTDNEFIYYTNGLTVDSVTSGGATIAHDSNSRDLTLSVVNATDGTSALVSNHFDIPYTAGHSQLIILTGTLDNADIGGGDPSIFIRTSTSGTASETEYQLADWTFNGFKTASKISDIDWSLSHIFAIDFQSLKVGRIRFFLERDGLPVFLHEITNDNTRNIGYWQKATLPWFYRIYNDSTYTYTEIGYGDTDNAVGYRYKVPVNASATMKCICQTVKSEGGTDLYDIPGLPFTADTDVNPKTVSTTLIPLVSIRVKSAFHSLTNRGLYLPTSVSLATDYGIRYVVLYRPALTNDSWVDVDTTYSGMEYDVSATAVSGGIKIDSDYVGASGVRSSINAQGILGKTIMSLGRTGTSDIISLCAVRNSNNNASVSAAIKWKEIY